MGWRKWTLVLACDPPDGAAPDPGLDAPLQRPGSVHRGGGETRGTWGRKSLVAELEAYIWRLAPGLVEPEPHRACRQLVERVLAQESAQKVCVVARELFFDFLWDLLRQAEWDDGPDAAFWR